MKGRFLYNSKTNKLHIRDHCTHSKGDCPKYIFFETEDEALAYGGRAVGMCKICQKEREKRMEER